MTAREAAGSRALRVPREVCRDFERASRVEWIEANGAGSFAMGTAASVATRRYHGLLVASAHPPGERALTLARVEETLTLPSGAYELATNQYPGAIHPTGYTMLDELRLDPFPVFRFTTGDAVVTRALFLAPHEPTVILRWSVSRDASLDVAPFVALRDYHALLHAADGPRPEVSFSRESDVHRATVRRGERALYITSNAVSADERGDWYYANEYLRELDRGFNDFREDLFRAFCLRFTVGPSRGAWLAATTDASRRFDDAEIAKLEHARRAVSLAARAPAAGHAVDASPSPITREDLCDAVALFRATRDAREHATPTPTVLAGYPWFLDWGRDTMISLRGFLAAGLPPDEARAILDGFLGYLDQGLIPNRFPDVGEVPEYNTVDATLWLFQAARAYVAAAGDAGRAFLEETLYPRAKEVLAWHARGTHHGIHVDPDDGLLVAGEPGVQLTWMDAKVGDHVVTPRHGKPVEVNALWFGALSIAADWARALGKNDDDADFSARAARVGQSFTKFVNPARGSLYDVLGAEGPDAKLRPNQIFAVSLPHPLLDANTRAAIVRDVREHLLTPYGLRTLAPGEPGYIGRYEGTPEARDFAYHQGTVWPWLLGAFVDAHLAVHGHSADERRACHAMLAPLLALMGHGHDGAAFTGDASHAAVCLGSIAEIFDGDAPHAPRGCPAQAWSVAEIARVYLALLG